MALLSHTASDTLRVKIVEKPDGLRLYADNPLHQLNLAKQRAGLPYKAQFANIFKNVELLVSPQALMEKLPAILHVLGVTAKKEKENWGDPIIFKGNELGAVYIDLTKA